MPSYDPKLKWPDGTRWPPDSKWAMSLGPTDPLSKEMVFWKEQAEFWKLKYEGAVQKYASLFPTGEAPGRIVMLFWDGKTWLRLDKPYTKEQVDKVIADQRLIQAEVATGLDLRAAPTEAKAGLRDDAGWLRDPPDWKVEYERLEKLVKKAEGQQWASPEVQELFRMVRASKPDIAKPIERTRRNNVVT